MVAVVSCRAAGTHLQSTNDNASVPDYQTIARMLTGSIISLVDHTGSIGRQTLQTRLFLVSDALSALGENSMRH